jgi:replication initiation protein RepC
MQPNQIEHHAHNPAPGRNITKTHHDAAWQSKRLRPDKDFDRFEVVNILKRVGTRLPPKAGKPRWSDGLIHHLELLITMTQRRDWYDGYPVVWMSVGETAHRLGISPSQVNENENKLLRLGAISFIDSGNYKRWGRRNADGRIAEAFGINLAPSAALCTLLRIQEAEILEGRQQWKTAKNAYSSMRRYISQLFASQAGHSSITEASAEFERLIANMSSRTTTRTEDYLAWHELLEGFKEELEILLFGDPTTDPTEEPVDNPQNSGKMSSNMPCTHQENTMPASCQSDAHRNTEKNFYKITHCSSTPDGVEKAVPPPERPHEPPQHRNGGAGASSDKPERKPRPEHCQEEGSGSKIDPDFDCARFVRVLSGDIQTRLEGRTDWPSLINLAKELGREMGISASAWKDGCRTMGEAYTSVCVLIVATKYDYGTVYGPGGYLRGMIRKAEAGVLKLMPTIYGLQASRNMGWKE